MKKILTIILDGFGYREEENGNAIKAAHMNTFHELWNKYPHALLGASEEYVGLAHGQAGNSEVGHMTIGAGRLLKQNEILVNDFFVNPDMENKNVLKLLENKDKDVHIMGLCSDGNIHAGVDDFLNMFDFLVNNGFTKIHFHLITDGRDTGVMDANKYIDMIKAAIKKNGCGDIATIAGRYYAMDRDKRWDRVKKCYDALVRGEGNKATSATIAIEDSYQKEVFDEFVEPTVICNGETPIATIGEHDSVIFFNFRPDRAREITRAIVDPNFDGFETKRIATYFVCFTNYDETMPNVKIAFKKELLVNTFGEVISKNGLTQLRIAETEKYAHVTFFFNGGEEKQYPGEDRILVPSPKVATYDLQPEMSAYEVTDKVIKAINSDKYNVIILNYANPDMVGHTGSLPAAIKAVETIDECVGKVVEAMSAHNGTMIITADHGNCEQMIDYKTGDPHTAHTTNPVPLILVTENKDLKVKEGKLADLAPTMLEILGIKQPKEMTGESILIKE